MTRHTTPTWTLSEDIAITRDKHNWIVLRKSGGRWRSESFFRTPHLLLKNLHQQIARTTPANPDLLEHLEMAYKVGERLSDKLSTHILESFGDMADLSPQRAAAIAKLEAANYAS